MKANIHPELMDTKVHCNGCDTEFVTRSTVPSITVEICSNCHPFYTGKQKLVDTAGRVEKFEARRKAAEAAKVSDAKRIAKKDADEAAKAIKNDPELAKVAEELKEETVDLPKAEDKTEAAPEAKDDNQDKVAPEADSTES
jgi:large subunit ribosomal protein L31